MKKHHYEATIEWTGNRGSGTSHYTSYERDHRIIIENKPIIEGSSDPDFRGNKAKHNPEELLISSLSSCHMLWYLHFCSTSQVIVEHYTDMATGTMVEEAGGNGYFQKVVLNPMVVVRDKGMIELAMELHKKAHTHCFIANSVNFPVQHRPQVVVRVS